MYTYNGIIVPEANIQDGIAAVEWGSYIKYVPVEELTLIEE